MKQYIVIGAGKFGSSVAVNMASMGQQVLVVDKDENKIQNIADKVTHAIIADATDEKTLKSLEIGNFDVAIIGIGTDIKSAMLVTLLAKEQGVEHIICKALDELQAKVLYKIGADRVVFPERDMGIRIAQNLLTSNILDSIELDPEYCILEITLREEWIGKTLKELNFRARYGLNVLAIKRGTHLKVTPSAEEKLNVGDILVILGANSVLTDVFEK